jgi:hypothetical protein
MASCHRFSYLTSRFENLAAKQSDGTVWRRNAPMNRSLCGLAALALLLGEGFCSKAAAGPITYSSPTHQQVKWYLLPTFPITDEQIAVNVKGGR